MNRTLYAVVLTALTISGQARADPGAPYRGKWTEVSLVSQTVDITLRPNKVTIEGTYSFHNTGKAVTMPVGYPRGKLEGELREFQVSVCGEPLTVKQGKPKGRSPFAYMFEGGYSDWKLFDVAFTADERKTLTIKYSVEPTKINTDSHGEVLYYS